MTTLFTKNQKIQNRPKFRTTKEHIESLKIEKEQHQKHFFTLEKQCEVAYYRILEGRKEQKYHKNKIYDLEKEIKKHSKPKTNPPKYNYTSFYFFVEVLIVSFISSQTQLY